MEIDVLHRVGDNQCSKYINRQVQKASVNLIILDSSTDDFITKKNIWNAAGRLVPGGIFCIQAYPENISDVIKLIKEQDFHYKVIYFNVFVGSKDTKDYVSLFVLGYKVFPPNINLIHEIESNREIGSNLINLSNFGDIMLFIGNRSLPFVPQAKILGRQVIAFGNDETWRDAIKSQGIKEINYG